MKKHIIAILIIFSTLILSACSTPTDAEESVVVEEIMSENVEENNNDLGYGAVTESEEAGEENSMISDQIIEIVANDVVMYADFADNSSAEAFKTLLSEGSLTVNMSDYGNFEKVGDIGTDLPRNDEQITTEPGDIILYLGNKITIYYDTNSWNFTRLGKITSINSDKSLKEVLGKGDVSVKFTLISKER